MRHFLSISALLLAAGCASPRPCPPAAAPDHEHDHEHQPSAPTPAPAPAAPAEPPEPSAEVLRELPQLPQKSPGAEVRQQVGITEIAITYSSPGKKGRKIWGKLLPFDEKWRTGANAPTRLTFDRPVRIGETEVPAGSYSVFTIPTAETLTVIVNRDPDEKGVRQHDEAQDVARIEVPLTDAPPRERMIFVFEDTTPKGTKLVLHWAGKRAAIPISVDTEAHVAESTKETLEAAWRPLFNAGRYALEEQEDAERGLELLDRSIAVRPTWWNHWWSAQALHELGRHDEARARAERADELGQGDRVYDQFFSGRVEEALAEWPKE